MGLNLGYAAVLIPQLENDDSTVHVTKEQSSWIASVYALSVLGGCFVSALIMDCLGRLNTIKLAAVPSFIGWTAIAMTYNYPVTLIGRILGGFAAGMGANPGVVYISEISDPHIRGALNSFCPLMAAFGMLLAYATGAIMSWRLAAGMNVFLALIPAFLIQFFAAESPVWLVKKGKIEKASESLRYLYKNYKNDEKTKQPIYEMYLNNIIKHEDEVKSHHNESHWRGFLKPTGYKPMLILIGMFFLQQISGIYIVMIYAVTFIQGSGATMNAYHASVLVGVTRFLMSIVGVGLLRRFDRQDLVICSSIGMTIFMSLAALFTRGIDEEKTSLTWVPLGSIVLYVCTGLIGMLTVPWTMTAELFPTEIRGLGQSIIFAITTLFMFITTQFFRPLVDLIGFAHTEWLFAVTSFFGSLYGKYILPETHGKTLAEIQNRFAGKKEVITKDDEEDAPMAVGMSMTQLPM